MKPVFIQYPRCSTCKKAAKWLKDNGIEFEERDIVVNNPTSEELYIWIKRGDRPASKFFNSSGLRYKALNLKDVVKTASQEQLIEILSTEGMLVKRPLLITDSAILVGFKEDEWRKEFNIA